MTRSEPPFSFRPQHLFSKTSKKGRVTLGR
jgi:hypothetical protein